MGSRPGHTVSSAVGGMLGGAQGVANEPVHTEGDQAAADKTTVCAGRGEKVNVGTQREGRPQLDRVGGMA